MRARRICLLTALTFAAVCCTPAGGPAPVAPPPPAGWSGPGPVPPPRRMRLFFGGDVMQHMPQVDAVRRGDGFDYEPVFRTLAPRIRAADLARLLRNVVILRLLTVLVELVSLTVPA